MIRAARLSGPSTRENLSLMNALPLLAAAEAAPPLIDIDGTVFIQFAIFLVMMAALYSLVFKPFFATRDERTRRIDGAKKDAAGMQDRATAMIADYEAKLLKAKQRGADERLKLRAEGQTYEREVLGTARAAGQKAMSEAMATARAQESEARAKLSADSQKIAHEVAGRILGRAV